MSLSIPEAKKTKPDLHPVFASKDVTVSYRDRVDPLHQMSWEDGVNTKFRPVGGVEHTLKVDAKGVLTHAKERVRASLRVQKRRLYTQSAMLIVANLVQYYQLSTMQLSTVTGFSPESIAARCSWLYAEGVLERADPSWIGDEDLAGLPDYGSGSIWRIDLRTQEFADWLEGLSDLEFLLITGGREITKHTNSSRSSSSLRHNLVAAELMIRSMEIIPSVIGTWGERFTGTSSLISESKIMEMKMRSNHSDGGIVTKDGQTILFETSGTANLDNENGIRIQEKAAAWAAICAMSDIPLRVVFVDIAPRPNVPRFRWHVKLGLDQVSKYLVNKRMQDRGTQSVFLANSYDWFPFAHEVSRGFQTLEAYSPLTGKYHDLIPASDAVSDAEHVANTLASMHTPDWTLSKTL